MAGRKQPPACWNATGYSQAGVLSSSHHYRRGATHQQVPISGTVGLTASTHGVTFPQGTLGKSHRITIGPHQEDHMNGEVDLISNYLPNTWAWSLARVATRCA